MVDSSVSPKVLIGLVISRHEIKTFPSGLHRFENVVFTAIALHIFCATYEMAKEASSATWRPYRR